MTWPEDRRAAPVVRWAAMWMIRPLAAALLVGAVLSGCHREPQPPAAFVQALRCGMTRAEVTALARQHGFDPSDSAWLSRSARNDAKKKQELTLMDLTFRGDHLVAFRQGTWNPRTRSIEYRTVDLCKGTAPP